MKPIALGVLFVVLVRHVSFGYPIQEQAKKRHLSLLPDHELVSIPVTCRRNAFFGMPTAAAAFVAALSLLGASTEPSLGLSPQDAANAYDTYASHYNDLDGGELAKMAGIEDARSQILSQAKGDVLEIGVGTGLNLDKYDPKKISSLTLVDISDGMLREAERRLSSLKDLKGVPVKFVKADATADLKELFLRGSFDTVVDTFSLCVFGNEGAKNSLDQIKTVVKGEAAGGQVLLIENSRSSNPFLGLYQDATADAVASMGGKGCLYNQDVGRLLRESKVKVRKEQQFAGGVFRSFVCTVPL